MFDELPFICNKCKHHPRQPCGVQRKHPTYILVKHKKPTNFTINSKNVKEVPKLILNVCTLKFSIPFSYSQRWKSFSEKICSKLLSAYISVSQQRNVLFSRAIAINQPISQQAVSASSSTPPPPLPRGFLKGQLDKSSLFPRVNPI